MKTPDCPRVPGQCKSSPHSIGPPIPHLHASIKWNSLPICKYPYKNLGCVLHKCSAQVLHTFAHNTYKCKTCAADRYYVHVCNILCVCAGGFNLQHCVKNMCSIHAVLIYFCKGMCIELTFHKQVILTLMVLSHEPLTIRVSSNCMQDIPGKIITGRMTTSQACALYVPWVWPSNVRTVQYPFSQFLFNRYFSANKYFHYKHTIQSLDNLSLYIHMYVVWQPTMRLHYVEVTKIGTYFVYTQSLP